MKTKLFIAFLFLVFTNKAQVWTSVGVAGPSGRIGALAVYNSELYTGGYFPNGDGTRDIQKWNGSTWATANRTISDNVLCLAVYNSSLYAGGYYTPFSDPNRLATIGAYNGTTWSPLVMGVDGTGGEVTEALTVYNGELYVGGRFSSVSSITATNIAKWNGTSWAPLLVGVQASSSVKSLAVYNSELYVGGTFTLAGGMPANYIAKWNGTTWSAVGTGLNNSVNTLTVYNGELYVGGNFSLAGGLASNKIAKWNGTSWSAVGPGMDNNVLALCVHNNELYAGGSFVLAGGVSANKVAKWNGVNWSALGTGMNNDVWVLGEYNSELYAGGIFTTADNTIANYIAKLNSSTAILEQNSSLNKITISPNPTSSMLNIELANLASISSATNIQILNILGQVVYQSVVTNRQSSINIQQLNSGIYFVKVLEDNKVIATQKVIKE